MTYTKVLITMTEKEKLYNSEQWLLKRLTETNDRQEQEVIKRQIGRINKSMETLDK